VQGVDPYNIPPKLSRAQLEEWILFGIMVAGKSADPTWVKLNAFFADPYFGGRGAPFYRVKKAIAESQLLKLLKKHKTGKYTLLDKGFREAVNLDLDHVSVDSLEQIHGIGMKTARMIMLYYIPGLDIVPLDTHILKYLRNTMGLNAPKATSGSRKQYLELEAAFIAEAKRQGKTTRDLDTEVWKFYANKPTATRRG
jgi:hypothetical protein